MLRSMYSGVSGLKNHQIRMDAIGNNIANVNTIGYKGSRVTFQDTLNQTMRGASAPNGQRGGINAVQVGLGMNLSSIDILNTQGNRQNTGNTTDLMIDGDGFFVVSDGGRQYYTRAGNFNLERDGRLVCASNGLVVQGWLADARGNISTNTPIQNITIPLGRTIAPLATTEIGFEKNLNSETNAKYEFKNQTITLKDADGNSVPITCKLTPVPDAFNQYYYDLRPAGSDDSDPSNDDTSYSIMSGIGKGTVTLDQYGNVVNITESEITIRRTASNDPIRLFLPEIGSSFGGFFTSNPPSTGNLAALRQNVALTGPPAFGTNNQQTFNVTVQDSYGNPVALRYDVTRLDNDRYRWTASVTNGGQVLSGPSGTFTWTSTNGVSDPSGGYLLIRSSAGHDIHIAPPSLGGGAIPTFRVVEYAPNELASTNAAGASLDLTLAAGPPNWPQVITFPDPAAPSLDNLTDTTGAPPVTFQISFDRTGANTYSWTYVTGSVTNATLVGTTIPGGTFTWDAANGVDNVSQNTFTFKTAANYEITIAPPIKNPGNVVSFYQLSGTPIIPSFETPPDVVTTSKVYDSLGVAHTITFRVNKTDTNEWHWEATEGSALPIINGSGTLTFDTQTGFVTNSPGGPLSFQPIGANLVSITPDFSEVTQGASGFDDNGWAISDFDAPYQDGYPLGTLQGINIDRAGRIIGVFSNGMNQNLGQVAMANFSNPGGLTRAGDTLFEESSNSGSARIGQAGTGGRGLVTPGAVEMANVDLSQEFTDMITTERGFQANSRIITTSDEMLQELVNLKR